MINLRSKKENYFQNLLSWSQQKHHKGNLQSRLQTRLKKQKIIQFIKQIFDHFIVKKCIYLFKRAHIQILEPNCEFFQNFKEWNYCKMVRTDQNIKESFKRNVSKFDKIDNQSQLLGQIYLRVKSFSDLNQIKKNFIQKSINTFLQNEDYRNQWEQLRNYLQKNKTYSNTIYNKNCNDIRFLQENKRYIKLIDQKTANIIHFFQQLFKYQKPQNIKNDFVKNMTDFGKQLTNVLKKFRDTYCQTVFQEMLVLQLIFLVKRGFQQLKIIYSTNKNLINDKIFQQLTCFKDNLKIFKQGFLLDIYFTLLGKISFKIKQDYALQKLIEIKKQKNLRQIFQNRMLFFYFSYSIFFMRKKTTLNQAVIQCQFQIIQNIIKACIFYIYDDENIPQIDLLKLSRQKSTLCLFMIISLMNIYMQSYQNKQFSLSNVEDLKFQLRKYLLSMADCLKNLKRYELVSYIYYLLEDVYQFNESMSKQIESQKNTSNKVQCLILFGKFNCQHDLIDKGIQKFYQAKSIIRNDRRLLEEVQGHIKMVKKQNFKKLALKSSTQLKLQQQFNSKDVSTTFKHHLGQTILSIESQYHISFKRFLQKVEKFKPILQAMEIIV